MAANKGFLLIELMYTLFLLFLLATFFLNQYAQVTQLLQETVIRSKALTLAQATLEATRANRKPCASTTTQDNYMITVAASHSASFLEIVVRVAHSQKQLVSLATGVDTHEQT